MSNFSKVGSSYVLKNLDIGITSLDSVLHINNSGNISNLPICRDYLASKSIDNYNKDSLLTFGSISDFSDLNGTHSYFGEYGSNWNLSNEWTNIGNTVLIENDMVTRSAYQMTVKRSCEALLTFNGKVKNKSSDYAYAWYRIYDDTEKKTKLEGTLGLFPNTYSYISFSHSVPVFIRKGAVLKFEMSCNNGANIEVLGKETLGWLTCLHLYPKS